MPYTLHYIGSLNINILHFSMYSLIQMPNSTLKYQTETMLKLVTVEGDVTYWGKSMICI